MVNSHDSTIPNGDANSALPQSEGSLHDILQIAVRHRWTILLTTSFVLVSAFFYILKATPIYRSESRLYVEQTGPRIISEYEGIMTRSGNYLYTQSELLKSTPVIGDAVDTANMTSLKTFADVDNPVGSLRRNLSVGVGRKDDIITVSFESPYPVEAAVIVNAVVDSYINYHKISKRSTAKGVLEILQTEKKKRDEELDAAFKRMLDFTNKNGIVSFDGNGGNVVFETLRTLSNELSQAEMAALEAKADYEAVLGMAGDAAKIRQFAAASVGQSVRVPDRETQLQAELRQAQTELNDARYHCTEEHPAVRAIKAKIDRINKELDEEAREFADAYIEVMRLRWNTAKEREQEVLASFESKHNEAKSIGVLAAEYSRLQSELARAERICEIVDNRIKELNVTEDVGALNINRLEVARPADNPSKPQKARIMAMALVLGLMFGTGLAFLRDWLDFRLRSSEEVSAILGIPVLGVVPKMLTNKAISMSEKEPSIPPIPIASIDHPEMQAATSDRHSESVAVSQDTARAMDEINGTTQPARKLSPKLESVKWVKRMSKKTGKPARATAVEGISREKIKTTPAGRPIADKGRTLADKPEIVIRGQKVHLDSRSVVAEAYRTIRTAVFFGAPKESAKTIHITSPAPGDGKSTLASNLAIAMAQAGQKTIIIDADFRKPVQHKIFELDDDKGLSSVLAGRDTIDKAARPGACQNLDVMACGPEVPNPSELLNSDFFRDTLKKLTENYDRVIIDSPPVGPVADSQIIAAICDVTLLVLRAEKSTRRQAQHARDSLLGVNARLLGAVVNDVQQKRGHYGYYSNYGNYGYYGKREKKTG